MNNKIKLCELYKDIYIKLLQEHGGRNRSQLIAVREEANLIFHEMIRNTEIHFGDEELKKEE